MTPATAAVLDFPTTDPRVTEPLQLADQARALVVTRENKVQAEETILLLNDAEKKVREVLDPIVETAFKAHRVATSKRAELLKPIEEARQHLRRGCGQIQQELEREAAAEARRKADEHAKQERARLQTEAEQIADRGDIDTAMDVLAEADAVQAAPVSTMRVEPPKAAGLTYRDNWTFGFVDAKGRPVDKPDVRLIPIEYLKVDDAAIRGVVKAMKERTAIPGVRAFNDRQPVGTARR
jgi:hypothetical protein